MNKWEVARVLDEIAKYVELSEANRFKSLAFEKASRAVSALDRDPAELIASGELQKTPGIGKTTASVIEEVLRTGKSRYLEELRKQYPAGIFELMRVPRLGLKKVGILYAKLGIGSLDDLEQACRTGRLKTLKGFGEKTQQKILEGIGYARKRESHFLLPVGLEAGEQIRERLADIDAVENAEVSGSVRRRLEVIRNVNIAVATRDFAVVKKALGNIVANIEELDANTVKGVARNAIDVYFHLAKPQEFGSTLLRTTGTTVFVDALLERAADRPAKSEEEIFERANAAFVAPERRGRAKLRGGEVGVLVEMRQPKRRDDTRAPEEPGADRPDGGEREDERRARERAPAHAGSSNAGSCIAAEPSSGLACGYTSVRR